MDLSACAGMKARAGKPLRTPLLLESPLFGHFPSLFCNIDLVPLLYSCRIFCGSIFLDSRVSDYIVSLYFEPEVQAASLLLPLPLHLMSAVLHLQLPLTEPLFLPALYFIMYLQFPSHMLL